ncbi:MAG: ABC transporter permease, partial [Bacteroidia bacterium]
IQVILDGRKSNGAQIVNGYLATLVNNYEQDLLINEGKDTLPAVIIERNWYNENLLYIWYTVPSLVGILSMLITLIITSMSVARERELGTYDQLLVSPLRPTEILIGKMAPAIIIGLLEGLLIWVVAVTIYGVPFRGSFVLLVFSIMLFALSIVGVGLFISSIAKTQQQAILGTFVFMVPSVSLSGYASPVENMPGWLQTATSVIPLKHFLITVKGLFLKDMTFLQVWSNTWPLLIIGSFTLTLAAWFFTKRLD